MPSSEADRDEHVFCNRKHLSVTRATSDVNRTRALLAAALGIILLAVIAAAVVPGVLADRSEQRDPAHLEYRESNVRAGAVTGETVTLQVESRVSLRDGPAENVTVVHRAIDENSGMLEALVRNELGTLDGEREFTPATNVTVPRRGSYEIRTTIYVDGEVHASGRQTVSGVDTLIPQYARTDVQFRALSGFSTDIPPIVYFVEEAAGDSVTLDVTPFLTNTGDEAEDGLELVVMARQAESNIVADRTTVPIDAIEPGQTSQPSVQLTVPDDYNYYLDAMLRRDGVVVGATSVSASLDPTESVPENETRRDVGIETGDFERDTPSRPEQTEQAQDTAGGGGPGFGAVGALAALLAGGLLYARRSR